MGTMGAATQTQFNPDDSLRLLVEQRCGAYFSDGRLHVLQSRVQERMRAIGCVSANAYLQLVSSSAPAGNREWRALLPSILNGDTAFFRHRDSFDVLARAIVPNWVRERRQSVSIWCAGCSTGEEAYSIASLVLSQGFRPATAKVLGTDLNETSLAKARAGVYESRDLESIPEQYRPRGFRVKAKDLEAGSALRAAVSFGVCNLASDPYPPNQDLIWCQNVLIYCREEWKSRIVAKFVESLRPGGYLLLSPVDAMAVRPENMTAVWEGHVPLYRKAD